jgi:hypothetical protein
VKTGTPYESFSNYRWIQPFEAATAIKKEVIGSKGQRTMRVLRMEMSGAMLTTKKGDV